MDTELIQEIIRAIQDKAIKIEDGLYLLRQLGCKLTIRRMK